MKRQIYVAVLTALIAYSSQPTPSAFAMQQWNGRNIYFGDTHWHSCLSQDVRRDQTPDDQYSSQLYAYGTDFSLESDHAEAADAAIRECGADLPPRGIGGCIPGVPGCQLITYDGGDIAEAMKAAADRWMERGLVTFPGYEWASDARCWQATFTGGEGYPRNTNNNTPGHINYFFSNTTGWSYGPDVWLPGNGDSAACTAASGAGFAYYSGSRDHYDEILGQLIHQRDDRERAYALLIQENHPASTVDTGVSSDEVTKWDDYQDGSCEEWRTRYGVSGVEWYAHQESAVGSTVNDPTGICSDPPEPNFCPVAVDFGSDCCTAATSYHDAYHVPERWVASRGLRSGLNLASWGGSDSHNGSRLHPTGFKIHSPDGDEHGVGDRGAGGSSLTAVYAAAAPRESIGEGLSQRRTYTLSRFRGIGPVHKGRVDFFLRGSRSVGRSAGLGEYVAADLGGSSRDFTISAAAEAGATGVFPSELRLYRVSPSTPLSTRTDVTNYWLDGVLDDPGKFGELLGSATNLTGNPQLEHTFLGIVVRPRDAVFAVVIYSDAVWVDDYYDENGDKLDEDGDGAADPGKTPATHGDDNTYARTTPIWFYAANEAATPSGACAHVDFTGSYEDPVATGGGDTGLPGDASVLPVAKQGVYGIEWNQWAFTLPADYDFVDLSLFNEEETAANADDDDDLGHLFAVRIDGQRVYSGRGGRDFDLNRLVELRNVYFPLKAGLHRVEIHMDDQECIGNGPGCEADPNFHCSDYDGPYGHLDAMVFHGGPDDVCGDRTPPEITCPANITREFVHPGVAVTFAATATDDFDPNPAVSCAPASGSTFGYGTNTVSCTATDGAGNGSGCLFSVTLVDTVPPAITCPGPLAVECSAAGGTPASSPAISAFLAGASATDAGDPSPAIGNDAPALFPTGATPVTFTATDFAGNSSSCQSTVNVADTAAPSITSSFALSPTSLSSPSHKLVKISVPTITSQDVCDPAPRILCSVASDEPANAAGLGDGDTAFDIVFKGEPFFTQETGERAIATTSGVGTFTLQLRGERDGNGDGRVYTVSCLSADGAGNRGASKTATVTVPH